MAKKATPKDNTVLIRMDAKLRAKLVKAAQQDDRTLSGYIRHVLEKHVGVLDR